MNQHLYLDKTNATRLYNLHSYVKYIFTFLPLHEGSCWKAGKVCINKTIFVMTLVRPKLIDTARLWPKPSCKVTSIKFLRETRYL